MDILEHGNETYIELDSAIRVKDEVLPLHCVVSHEGSLESVSIGTPNNVPTAVFPWEEFIDNLACVVLMLNPGLLEPGEFHLYRFFEQDEKADGILIQRYHDTRFPTLMEMRPITAKWFIEKTSEEYVSTLMVLRSDGYPRMTVKGRYDFYGGVVN